MTPSESPDVEGSAEVQEFCDAVNDMKNGLALVRETIKSLQEKCAFTSVYLAPAYIVNIGTQLRSWTRRAAYRCYLSSTT